MSLSTGNRTNGISIVIPCLNEEGNVETMYERVTKTLRNKVPYEIIFIDDGSSDSTFEKIELLKHRNQESSIKLLRNEQNLGIHKSWINGVNASTFELICLIDGDLQNPPEAIWNLYQAYIANASDFVQGSRSSIGRAFDGRFVMSRILNAILNFVFNQHSYDSKSGFVVANHLALKEVLETQGNYRYFQTFLGVAARSKGFRVHEIETYFDQRRSGESFVPGIKAYLARIRVLMDFPIAMREYGRRKSFRLGGFLLQPHQTTPPPHKARLFYNVYWATIPIHKWVISRNAKNCFEWLKQTEFLSRSDLNAIVSRRWSTLYRHAVNNVPYYRELYTHRKEIPAPGIQEMSKLPLLSKQDVRDNLHFDMFSIQHDKETMHKITTSGSTGEPFVCYADQFQLEMRLATTLRALQMTGWNFGEKQLRLWHQTLGMSRIQAVKEKLDALLLRRTFVPAFEFTETKVDELLDLIGKKQPVLIDGYAESLNFISSTGFKDTSWRPKAVMSSAQQLTNQTRTRIEQKFSTRLFDKYGSREFSGIAYQCEFGTYHVQEESYIVEILINGRTAQPGEIGEIVITDLNNFSTPMIRYAIGDLAKEIEQKDCECGRPHRAIGEIVGRRQALIKCGSGVWLPGTFFAHFFKEFEYCVRQFQVIQVEEDSITIRVVPTSQFNVMNQKKLLSSLQKYTGDTTLILECTQEIPLLKTGKRTPVISALSERFLPENIQVDVL